MSSGSKRLSSLINGVGSAANTFFAASRKPDTTTAGPSLPTGASMPVPGSAQIPINGRLTLAEQVRAGPLEARQRSGEPIGKMAADARNDFEEEIVRQVQAQLLANPELQSAALLDVKA